MAILGIGGMGKTALIAQSVREMAASEESPFEALFWRSLLNAPPPAELLPPMLQVLSKQQLTGMPEGLDEQLRLLMDYLRDRRVLLVLDNMESILDPERAGAYRPGYEPYGQLIQQIATLEHQSHLILTSRERPRGYARLEKDSRWVQTIRLEGLDDDAGHELLVQRGLHGVADEETMLIARYSGNPLALKLVADTVDEIFGGDISEFLTEESLVFDDIRNVLDQHFARLTELERDVLLWLAVEREETPIPILRQRLLQQAPQRTVVEALRGLRRRSLLEQRPYGFGLQNVITEYLTDYLVAEASQEIITGQLSLLGSHTLQVAKSKEYVRQSQARLILQPVGKHVMTALRSHAAISRHLQQLLDTLREPALPKRSYAGGNLLNLALTLGIDITGFDFSQINVWHANLQNVLLATVNFAHADLTHSVFTDTFDDIFSIAFSPDGRLFAAATRNGHIRIWRTKDRRPERIIDGPGGTIWALAFSPDGQALASGGQDHNITLWDVEHGYLQRVLQGHEAVIHSLAFSPDGTHLASGGADHTVRLWHVESGRCTKTLDDHANTVYAVAFSPDGAYLASAGVDQSLCLWYLKSDTVAHILPGLATWARAIAFSSDGRRLACAGVDNTVLLWDLPTLASGHIVPQLTLSGHTDIVLALAFSPDGQTLATSSADTTVRLWNPHSGELHNVLKGHSAPVYSIAFNPQPDAPLPARLRETQRIPQSLASGGVDKTVRLWDITATDAQIHFVLHGFTNEIRGLAFSADGTRLSSGSYDRMIRVWDVATGEVTHLLTGHRSIVMAVAFSRNGQMLASGGRDGTARLWHLANDGAQNQQTSIRSFSHNDKLWSIAFSPDDDALATACDDQIVRVWDVETGQVRRALHGHSGWIRAVAFSPDGQTLASGSSDRTVRLWTLAAAPSSDHAASQSDNDLAGHSAQSASSTPNCQVLRGHEGFVFALAYHPDGRKLASGSADKTVRLWDLAADLPRHGTPLVSRHDGAVSNVLTVSDVTHAAPNVRSHQILEGHDNWILSICFSPDGHILASSSADRTIRLWDAASGQLHTVLLGHTHWVWAVAFSPDARLLASSSSDETIRLWDVATGECLEVWHITGPYDGTNISGVTGITEAQRAALKALGAVENGGIKGQQKPISPCHEADHSAISGWDE